MQQIQENGYQTAYLNGDVAYVDGQVVQVQQVSPFQGSLLPVGKFVKLYSHNSAWVNFLYIQSLPFSDSLNLQVFWI